MKYSIDKKSIRYLRTNSGVMYTADLLADGHKICQIRNNGDGGDTHTDGSMGRLQWDLQEVAKSALPDSFEPISDYLEFLMDESELK